MVARSRDEPVNMFTGKHWDELCEKATCTGDSLDWLAVMAKTQKELLDSAVLAQQREEPVSLDIAAHTAKLAGMLIVQIGFLSHELEKLRERLRDLEVGDDYF